MVSSRKRFFFITGLPRCRSAWLANYLTYGDSFCLHDGFYGLNDINEFPDRLRSIKANLVGCSDPALLLNWRKVKEWFPGATWIVVERDLGESIRSSEKAFGVDCRHQLLEMRYELDSLIPECNAFRVEFKELDCVFIEWILGLKMPPKRREMLERLNIQVDPRFLRREMDRIKNSRVVNQLLKRHESFLENR